MFAKCLQFDTNIESIIHNQFKYMSDDDIKDDKDEVEAPIGDIDPEAVSPIIEPEEDLEVPVDDLGFGGEDEFGDPLIKPIKRGVDDEEPAEDQAEEEDSEDDPYDDIDEW